MDKVGGTGNGPFVRARRSVHYGRKCRCGTKIIVRPLEFDIGCFRGIGRIGPCHVKRHTVGQGNTHLVAGSQEVEFGMNAAGGTLDIVDVGIEIADNFKFDVIE